MRPKRDALTDLKTAFNCPAKWSTMRGDERVRHCSRCSRNVYNISQMTREEAVQLIEENGDKVCIRFYQKADGTILTKPCDGPKQAAHGWKMAGLTALAVIGFPIVTPVYAGQAKPSPRTMFKISLKKVQMYNQDLREAKDNEERETIIRLRHEAMKHLRLAYERMDPEEVEELGPVSF